MLVELPGDVVLLGSAIGITDGEVVFGSVSGAIRAPAPGPSASDVTLDERTAKQMWIERGDLFEQGASLGLKKRGGPCP